MRDYSIVNQENKSSNQRFDLVNQTIIASQEAFQVYSKKTLNSRRLLIKALRENLLPYVEKIAQMELEEIGMGNVDDKIIKLILAIVKTPGVEDLETEVITGDKGMTLHECSPYGVIAAFQPGTNPCATLISNVIGMLASGNSVINIPNPRCVKVSEFATNIITKTIMDTCGLKNLVTIIDKPSMSIAEEIMNHPDVALVVATGGRKMVSKALESPKRVIAAGEANPVVVVDETANIKKAAKDIVDGASFDHNIMCIGEKSVVVVSKVVHHFVNELKNNQVYYIDNDEKMMSLCNVCLTWDLKLNRRFEGKSANEILEAAGIPCLQKVRLVVVKTIKKHPFVTEEMLMPIVPIVVEDNFEEAINTAQFIESGLMHTAIVHSQSIDRLNYAARELKTSVFIKNGSSLTGIGLNGEDRTSFTIANITGEGMTTARNFARIRSCTLTSGFSIR